MPSTQSTQIAAPSLPAHTQLPVPQNVQAAATSPAPTQPPPRQVQLLALPVQLTVAKPKPVEKPPPREKRIFVVSDHQRCVMSNLSSLWKSGKLCDAGIGNGSSTVRVSLLSLYEGSYTFGLLITLHQTLPPWDACFLPITETLNNNLPKYLQKLISFYNLIT